MPLLSVGPLGLAVDHLQTEGALNQLFLDVVSLVVVFEPLRDGDKPPLTASLHFTLVVVRLLLVSLQLGLRG